MKIAFTKMQGLGNDFMLINGITQAITLDSAQIRAWADRHYGIGFDQLLLIEKARSLDTAFFYRIFNADGQEVEQCGNGARCVAYYAFTRQLVATRTFMIGTQLLPLTVTVETNEEVTVNMGAPIWEPAKIPFIRVHPEPQVQYALQLTTTTVALAVVSMGNPHAVVRVASLTQAPMATLGAAIASHPDFPQGVNVGFMQILSPTHIGLRVLERGAGETLACGSGACAAVAVGRLQGWLQETVRVDLPGGQLQITWHKGRTPVLMRGPAVVVFEGEMAL